jgi:hypothetical protein
MSVLGQSDVPEEVVQAIQDSLPDGQVVRQVGLLFSTTIGSSGQVIRGQESFVAVTDDIVAFRNMRWDREFTSQQIKEKQALESEQILIPTFQPKIPKFAKRFIDQVNIEGVSLGKKNTTETSKRKYSDSQILEMLIKKYGPIEQKWLPEVISSSDILISDFIVKKYAEVKPSPSLLSAFEKRGHQLDLVGYFEYSVDGSVETLCSFFNDIRKIYDHIRNAKLGNLPTSNSVARITKCLNCGSTELTVKEKQVVCDFCQSKFAM